jgi:hypothetical protein
MSRYLFLLLLLVCIRYSHAQNFTHEASLPPVSADGFYQILLSPEVSDLSNSFSDIRIHDTQGKEVPYLLQEEQPVYASQTFHEYEILEKKQEAGCCTSLTLHNPDRTSINNISLVIKNAEVTKDATLLGSDDQKQWFALKQHFVLNAIDNKNETTEIKIVDFPLSNYRYYSLRIDDSTSAPLNILKAGYYDVVTTSGLYTPVTAMDISKNDHDRSTDILVVFNSSRIVDKMEFSMTGPPYFLRKARLSKVKRGEKNHIYIEPITSVELSSAHPSVISLPGTLADELMLEIENDDNPPLGISSVHVYQLNRYLTTWLKAGEKYSIKVGNKELTWPVYDLAYFRDSIPDQPAQLAVGNVIALQKENTREPSPTFFTNKNIIWVAVILIVVVLGFLSVRMLKDTAAANKKE